MPSRSAASLLRFLALLFLINLGACGSPPLPSSSPHIIGGSKSPSPSYFAALHEQGKSLPFCGGSLIAPDLVLTAAHCVSRAKGPLAVWLGVEDLQQRPEAREVEALVIHPQYHASRYQHDLALLFLKKSSISSKAIPLANSAQTHGLLRVFGFGNVSRTDHEYPQFMQSTTLKEIAGYSCQTLGGPYNFLLSEQVCAGDLKQGLKDSCDGDSGGPLITETQKPELYGIVSWGVGCGLAGRPGVYTRVSSYADWIKASKSGPKNSMEDLVFAVFYYPLFERLPGADGLERTRRFTAGYHIWQEAKSDQLKTASAHWSGSFRGKSFKLELRPQRAQHYLLRLEYLGKFYETPATFTEISPKAVNLERTLDLLTEN